MRFISANSDGAIRCGPFCAVFNALDQMTIDSEVDLFTITRQLQTRRPEFISSLVTELSFIKSLLYLNSDSTYVI